MPSFGTSLRTGIDSNDHTGQSYNYHLPFEFTIFFHPSENVSMFYTVLHTQPIFALIFESGFNTINFWEIQNMKISCRHRIACKFQNPSLDIQMGVFLKSKLPVPVVNCIFHILKLDAAASSYFITPLAIKNCGCNC